MYSSTNNEIPIPITTYTGWSINWGAIFATLVFIYALSWLLFTLSSAIGLSIVEIPNPHDTDVKSESLTLSIALYAWLIGTILITYFCGGLLVGKLSGNADQGTLMLHGLVMWSCTILIAILLGAMGVNSLLSSAASAVKTTATVGMNLPNVVSVDNKQLPSSFQPLISSLKQGIKKGGSQDDTNSSQQDDNSNSKSQNASDSIDPQALRLMAFALIQGDEKQAKEIIASSTDLDEKQVDELVNSVKSKADKIGKDIEKKANEVRQYASGILWLTFISYIVALFASILGARWGSKELSHSIYQTK
ncbi:hypothetical protein [Nitrosomonas ureae]|uniref:Uncharacterized protein n=1 Tax=Nitrosomonas ureae TaxID=44577 RepID=A0A286AKE2_9PROT|nr:hypothetical protein [Nitrosomonas ureae]SOD22370.1 hypothetical protein SAMN06297164_3452 [Nitrosomonas ureae]